MATNIFIIIALSFILPGVLAVSDHDCISRPISVSNITNCFDKSCKVSVTTDFVQTFDGNTETCIDYQTPNNTVANTLHFAGSKTAATYPLIECYFTDDPAFNFTFTCSCFRVLCAYTPLFCNSVYDASNCPLPNTTTTSIFDAGTQAVSDCVASVTGVWCSRLSFTAYPRYKVCKLGTPTYSALFNIHDDTGKILLDGVYTGLVQDYNTTYINLTLSGNLVTPSHAGSFILWDKHDPSNYYILPSSMVNDINSYEGGKIGWLKLFYNIPTTKLTADDFDVAVLSCKKNVSSLRNDLLNIASYLTRHPENLGAQLYTDRALFDNEYQNSASDEGSIPKHYLYPYKYIVDGAPIYDSDGEVVFLGVQRDQLYNTFNITFKPDYTFNIAGIGTKFSDGATYGTFNAYCRDFGWSTTNMTNDHNPIYCILLTPNAAVYSFAVCSTYNPGVGLFSQYTSYCGGWSGVDIVEKNLQFWPENKVGDLKFNGTFNKIVNMDVTGGTFFEYFDVVSANAILSFNNVTISFDTTTVKPKIIDCEAFYDVIKFTAFSTSNPGSCYAEVSPIGITATESIFLTNEYNHYAIDITTDKYVGDATLTLKCYRYTVNCALSLNYVTNSTFGSGVDVFDTLYTNLNPVNAAINFKDLLYWIEDYFSWPIIGSILWVTIVLISLLLVIYFLRTMIFPKIFGKRNTLKVKTF